MQKVRKIIFWVSISFILLVIVFTIAKNAVPFGFITSDDEDFFDTIKLVGIPIAILFTLTGTIKQKDCWNDIVRKLLITLITVFIAGVMVLATIFDKMCYWRTEKILFQNKKDQSSRIALRSLSCDSTDGGRPTYSVFKVTNFASYFILVSDIDTNKINKADWTRVVNKEQ